MKPSSILLAFALALLAAAGASGQYTASQAAGYKAGITCSAVFLAGRSLQDILRDELGGPGLTSDTIGDPVVDYVTKSVSVAYDEDEPPRLAVHHPGFGTVLLPPGATRDYREKLPQLEMPFPDGDPSTIPWPDGDMLPDVTPVPDVDRAKLDAAVEAAFGGKKYAPHKTLGVVIVYKGAIVAERYAPTWDMHTQYRSWSSAKSITNALVGILVGDGKLTVDQPVPIPEWRSPNDPRRHITIENLLHMSSGLRSTGSATGAAYWGGIDTGVEVARSELEVEPGTRWKYSNYDTLLLVRSIEEVLPDQQAYWTFPRRRLLNTIGMRHTYPEIDAHGNFILSSQMYTTPRDLARFGLLFLNDGVWNGERILPEGWVTYTQKPAPAKRQRDPEEWGYGKQFWLLGDDPRVPDDTYTTAGARGQHSTIVPSRDLVVVRTGLDPRPGSNWDQVEFVADVIAAIDGDS